MKSHFLGSVLTATLLMAGSVAADAADAAKGKRVWNKCRACHSLTAGKNMTGPSLASVIGREAGTAEKYKYSKAMLASGFVWDEETLTSFLKAPRKTLKGTKMIFPGLKKPDDAANLIAYMKENGG